MNEFQELMNQVLEEGLAKIDELEKYRCPKCDGYIPNNENIGKYSGAISRRDNKTEICSSCGTVEALEDYFGISESDHLKEHFKIIGVNL